MRPLIAKALSIESRELWFQLRQDYLQEALVRPVFVWGAGLGTGLFLAALLFKDGRLRVIALVVLAAAGLAVVPYLNLRAKAETGRHPREAPAEEATRLRRDSRWVFLALGAASLANLLWGGRERLGAFLTTATVVGGVSATLTGVWLEAYDGEAMHFSPPSRAEPPARTHPEASTATRPAAVPGR